MKIRLALSLTIRRDTPDPDDITVDLVGRDRDIPAAGGPVGFGIDPDEERRR